MYGDSEHMLFVVRIGIGEAGAEILNLGVLVCHLDEVSTSQELPLGIVLQKQLLSIVALRVYVVSH